MTTQEETFQRADWHRRRLAPLENASRQLITFQDLKNVDKALLRAFYKSDVTTIDAFMSTTTTDLLIKLQASTEVDATQAIGHIENWRQQVRMLWEMRLRRPLPTQWS